MANPLRRHPDNASGPWFVDDSCIDCDASRICAPTIFGERGGQSVVLRQPVTPDEIRAATRAMLVCPTGSIGAQGVKPDIEGLFPEELEDQVYLCGYNSPQSYGANTFFARRPSGNLLVDGPRFVRQLVRRLEELGGVSHVLLTHRDDIGDAQRFAEHFGARVHIHEADRRAAPFVTDVLVGVEPTRITDDLLAIPLPGHTRGSVAYLLESRFLFSGDSLYWSRATETLAAFSEQCWYSWSEQTESLARLAAHPFEWVLAGHGGRHKAPAPEMKSRLEALVARMRAGGEIATGW